MGTDGAGIGTRLRARPAAAWIRPAACEHSIGTAARRSPRGWGRSQRLGLRVAGAGLLAATAAIHLDLYLTG
jgi:hypothetical protein